MLNARASSGVASRSATVLGWRVIGDAVEVRLEELGHFGEVVRSRERVRKRVEDAVVERDQRGKILDLHAVLALEADRVDGARADQHIDDLGVQSGVASSLKRSCG